MKIEFERTIPVLRMFDETKAKEFYVDFLGFTIEFESRFAEHAPLYMQLRRGDMLLHLSEHHGDASPGSTILVVMTGLDELHRELNAKDYKYYHPCIETMPWNARIMQVGDPFGNRIRFHEEIEQPKSKRPKKSTAKKRKRQ